MLLTDTVFIGEDDNSGGGSEAGLDAVETYTLDFTGIEPHPSQGFHVKLTINAEGSQGADVKHKVFWVEGCARTPTDRRSRRRDDQAARRPTATPTNGPKTPNRADGQKRRIARRRRGTPQPVPTAVPLVPAAAAGVPLRPLGLVLAGSAAVAGTAVVARRRFLHDS